MRMYIWMQESNFNHPRMKYLAQLPIFSEQEQLCRIPFPGRCAGCSLSSAAESKWTLLTLFKGKGDAVRRRCPCSRALAPLRQWEQTSIKAPGLLAGGFPSHHHRCSASRWPGLEEASFPVTHTHMDASNAPLSGWEAITWAGGVTERRDFFLARGAICCLLLHKTVNAWKKRTLFFLIRYLFIPDTRFNTHCLQAITSGLCY